ncbi:hypothetical protein EMPS_09521 [Entomortierella parvispora]|uniref:Transmembrane protein 198 n=1 Tax=Entomortierella parvispora TaxID=205924 RepID=A0A9P3HIZ6_9FUNG|nr:hypothetical protein EMPS_09521 [Entomortierella parvispora]
MFRTDKSLYLGLLALCCLSFLTCTAALPLLNSTVTPIGGDQDVNLNVGQHVRVTSENWGLGVVLIVFGLMEVFYGFKLIRITLIVAGFLSWAIAAMMIMVAIRWDLVYTTFMPQYYYLWVWLLAGLIGATLSFRYWDLGVTFTGAFGGFAVAMGIIAAANLAFTNAGRYVILAILILCGAAVATFYERVFIILGTSFGGAYMFMFGLDEFVQVGYREMIVIFDFTGQTLVYHPNAYVYAMLGSSLVLAGLGIAWEFWHHETPFFVDRKELFRIYGRPFGKRPRKLAGQRIHQHLQTKEWYAYIRSCACLKRWTIEDVLYNEEDCVAEIGQAAPTIESVPQAGELPSSVADPESSSKGEKTQGSGAGEVPLKTAPMDDPTSGPQEQTTGSSSDRKPEAVAASKTLSSEGTSTNIPKPASSPTAATESEKATSTSTTATITTSSTTSMTEHIGSSSRVESHGVYGAHLPFVPTQSTHPGPHHPLFSSHIGTHTMELVGLVADDMSPGNTIPREYMAQRPSSASAATSGILPHLPLATPQVLHMFEFSENTLASSHKSQGSESSLEGDTKNDS